jgi:zinc protease
MANFKKYLTPFILKVGAGCFLLTSTFMNGSAGAMTPYKKAKLDNGMEIVSLEDHKVPLVTIVIAVKAGAMSETPETNGLTHLWEHMFFKGNKLLPNQEAFNQRVRELGIIFNGDTSAEKVRYYFTLPSVYLEQGLEFMAAAITSPLLDTKEIEKERQVVLNEYDRNASQPAFKMYNLRRRLIYGGKGYLRDPLGSRDVIAKASREQLMTIKSEVFVPSNSCLLVGGDFDEKKLQAAVKKYFSDWKDPAGYKPVKAPAFPSFPAERELVVTHKDAQNVNLSITYEGPKARLSPEASYAADMLIQLLGHRSGKFHHAYIESSLSLASGLAYYTQSQAGEITLYGLALPEKVAELKKALLSEPQKWLEKDYFTEEQLEDVRRQLTVDYKLQRNKPSEYTNNLAFWWAVTGLDYYDSYLDNLRKVTLEDIRSFIRTYMIGKPRVISLFLSPDDAKAIGMEDNSSSVPSQLLDR